VFEIVDELATQLESMPNIFEGNALKEQKEANGTYSKHENNDEHLVGLRDACRFLYLRAPSSKLALTMLLMNVCIVHGVSNKYVNELLSLLHKYLLPLGNFLIVNMYHANALTRKVRLDYKLIHVCQNGRVLF
jgi:hypothetical protein